MRTSSCQATGSSAPRRLWGPRRCGWDRCPGRRRCLRVSGDPSRSAGGWPHHGGDRKQRVVPTAGLRFVGFDPSLREGEDVALNQATMLSGLSFGTVPGLLVEHIENKTFPESLRWLFTSGKGATRQLLTYRQIRVPDLAAGAFLPARRRGVALAVVSARSGSRFQSRCSSRSAPSTSAAALRRHCDSGVPSSPPIAIDCALLLAYFTGRLVGLTWLLRPKLPRKARPGEPIGAARDRGDDSRPRRGRRPGCPSVARACCRW